MDQDAATAETERGRALFRELLWVHEHLRRDLATVERLARDAGAGMSAAELRAQLDELKAFGPLWRLKVNCLRYCQFVHAHHGAEDAMLFPILRDADPALAPVVDRLEADHRLVSELLDDIEAAARALTHGEPATARAELIAGLERLHGHLLEHLDYEELSIGPALRRLQSLPGY